MIAQPFEQALKLFTAKIFTVCTESMFFKVCECVYTNTLSTPRTLK